MDKHLQFEVADFNTAHHTIISSPGLTKFMVVPHYPYMLLNMPGPNGVIFVHDDVKQSYACDRESCELAESQAATSELEEIKKVIIKLGDPVSLLPPLKKPSPISIQPEEKLTKAIPLDPNDPSKVTYIGDKLEPK